MRQNVGSFSSRASVGSKAPASGAAGIAGVFGETFGRLRRKGVVPGVLYPAVHAPSETELRDAAESWAAELPAELAEFLAGPGPIFLSINRYERKKVPPRGESLALKRLWWRNHEP